MSSYIVVDKTNFDLQKELVDLRRHSNREVFCKGAAGLAALVAGIMLIVFLTSSFLGTGVGLIVIGTLVLEHYIQQYRRTNSIYTRTINALNSALPIK